MWRLFHFYSFSVSACCSVSFFLFFLSFFIYLFSFILSLRVCVCLCVRGTRSGKNAFAHLVDSKPKEMKCLSELEGLEEDIEEWWAGRSEAKDYSGLVSLGLISTPFHLLLLSSVPPRVCGASCNHRCPRASMLTGVCNPMVFPIHADRPLRAPLCQHGKDVLQPQCVCSGSRFVIL